MIAVNASSTVNWSHPLNRGLVGWWFPGVLGFSGGNSLYNLCSCRKDLVGALAGTGFGVANHRGDAPTPGAGSLRFSDSSHRVNMPTNSFLHGTNKATISLWVKSVESPVPGDLDTLIAKSEDYASAASNQFFLRQYAPVSAMQAAFSDGSAQVVATTSTYLPLNRWIHVAAVLNGTNAKVYWDGVEKATAANGSFTTLQVNTSSFKIGATGHSSEAGFDGFMTDFRIHRRALTERELRQYVNLTKSSYDDLILPTPTLGKSPQMFSPAWAHGNFNNVLGG